MQMLTDNQDTLIYVFGIPLMLITVAVVLGWIKSIRRGH
jgi:predicted hotdog family 3-hydroxylacyl-ACP dehydratase